MSAQSYMDSYAVLSVDIDTADLQRLRELQLEKQVLRIPSTAQPEEVVRDQIGLHSTDYWTPYISLYSRIGPYDTSALFDKINNSERLFRVNAFRGTIHLVHEEMLAMISKAVSEIMYKRLPPPFRKYSAEKHEYWLQQVEDIMSSGPVSTNKIREELPELKSDLRWILYYGISKCEVIRGASSHARSNRTDYQLLEQAAPAVVDQLTELTVDEAIAQLSQEYVRLFGPVTATDFAWWLPYSKTKSRKLFNDLEHIKRFEIHGEIYFVDEQDLSRMTDENPDISNRVWFLPYEDHFAKAYAPEHRFYVNDNYQDLIYPTYNHENWPINHPSQQRKEVKMRTAGEKRPSIWADGKIVGRWEINDSRDTDLKDIAYNLFDKHLSQDIKQEISEQCAKLHEFINYKLLPIS